MRRVLAIFLVAAIPALAQERPPADPTDIETIRDCLAANEGSAQTCLGAIADPCQEEPGGSNTLGIVACLVRETAGWDVFLNENYRTSIETAKGIDARLQAAGVEPTATRTLRAAQRAWIAFRDAECARLYARDQEGSIRTIVFADCERSMTARRALDLAPDPG